MIYRVLLFLIILLFFSSQSCVSRKKTETVNDFEQNISFLALGDSYTIGESISQDLRWPNQLVKELKRRNIPISAPEIIAKTGWRTDELLLVAQNSVQMDKYDLVGLLIGVNNEFQGQPVESFEQKFEECLTFAISKSKFGKVGVFVLSIPDYGYTPFGSPNQANISKRIDAYNSICEAVSKRNDISFFSITEISRNGISDPSLVAEDNLHPSGKQYTRWVTSFVNALLEKITANQSN